MAARNLRGRGDPELVAAQKKQQARLDKQEAEAAKEKKAALQVVNARGGGGSSVNLNQTTGRAGIAAKLGGGEA